MDPPFDPPADFMLNLTDLPWLRRLNWCIQVRFPDVHAGWDWLAEMLRRVQAGIPPVSTATPHMGKDFPFYALWKLLEPDVLSTQEAFQDSPRERRRLHFLRRTKEEMVYLDGRPLYPKRVSDTLG